MLKNYVINTETSALVFYFHNGYEYTQVLEGKETFFVSQSPDEIVKKSFLHIGYNLKGAIKR
ncbi:competence protein ComK [Bacillus sp. V3B]|uniref:competence protein ComK n=1 Tax=Bacillus sp. V3B TaxID=2804915 RepID=UPI00210863D9|nr:competence protein ComK [Bacillus sp. V3B]MCQ6274729.1 competence protein ComK [Bacillus sp. V3B]